MSLYRGAGGASDATDDSTVNAVAGYASAAASSATAADASADAADASATSAAASASSAASSVSTVATHATNASNSASLAADYAAQAQLAKEAAEASEVIATERAGEASTYASQAAASASSSVHKTGDETIAGTKTFSSTITGSITGNAGTVTNGVYTTGDQTIAGTKTFSSTISGSVSGNAGTVTNGVYTTGNQTIAGTKTLSSNPVLSAGTANGVAYLNGSKVLTSGSALMFDGTSVFGLASASPEFKLGRASGNQPKLSFGPTSATDFYLQASSATGILRYDAGPSAAWGGIHAWYVDQSEQMRLTSTGLGIGTSSPSQLLTLGNTSSVRGQLYIQAPNGGSPTVTWDNTNSPSGHKFIAYGGGAGGTAAWSLYDATAAAYRLEVSGDGNLGLGVTPSAWAGFTASQVKNAALWSDGNTAFLSANTYFNSGYKYIATAAASQYLQASGVHTWYTAPSGTAGNAISFTQAMTLDASGNLLVGTTSNAYSGKIVGYGAPFVSQNTGTTASDRFYFVNGNGIVGYIQTAGSATSYNTSSDYRLKDITGPITTSGAYIDSLNPVEGTWKADGSTFVGLIAHEVQEASRTNVATGVKDGEQMQGMDYSNAELIANMAAELKSLRQRLAAAGIA